MKSLKWSNSGQGPLVLARIDRELELTQDGVVTLGFAGRFDSFVEILVSSIQFDKQVPGARRVAMLREAVIGEKKSGPITAERVLRRLWQAQTQYLTQPLQRYVLLSSASIRFGAHLQPIRLRDRYLSFHGSRPSPFPLPSEGFRVKDDTPKDFTYVKVFVSARDPHHAGEIAFDTLDLLRSFWNIHFNARIASRIGSSRDWPVNPVLPGPIHTLHSPAGDLQMRSYWRTTQPSRVRAIDLSQDWKGLGDTGSFIRRQIARSSFGSQIARYLIRYVRALDETDLHTSLLRLWGTLEDLTGVERANYEVLVRRASFLWDDYAEARLLLNHIRERRNQMVHAGAVTEGIERLVFQLKEHVEAILGFVLHYATRFEAMEAIWEVLDLPPDTETLRERIRRANWGMKFRSTPL